MIYIVKSQNLLKMFVSTTETELVKRLDNYLIEYEIIDHTLGTIQDVKNLLKEILNKKGWFENNQDNINTIKSFIDDQTNTVLKEVDRKFDYYIKKLNRYVEKYFFLPFNPDIHWKVENITYNFEREENLLKDSNYTQAMQKIELVKLYYHQFWEAFRAKIRCTDLEPVSVSPDYKLSIKVNWLDSSKVCTMLTLYINDRESYEIRSFLKNAK